MRGIAKPAVLARTTIPATPCLQRLARAGIGSPEAGGATPHSNNPDQVASQSCGANGVSGLTYQALCPVRKAP